MNLSESTLDRGGFKLHYWTGGAPDSPLVVFTHGATIDHHEWDATLPIIGEHFRVLTWDMRGHGLSRPASFSMPAAVQDLLDILDELQVSQALFVGHSLGGNLHQELVFHHPERVLGYGLRGLHLEFSKDDRTGEIHRFHRRTDFQALSV